MFSSLRARLLAWYTVVLAAVTFTWDIPWVLNPLIALVAALTLLSIAFYVAEWVRHMNATG